MASGYIKSNNHLLSLDLFDIKSIVWCTHCLPFPNKSNMCLLSMSLYIYKIWKHYPTEQLYGHLPPISKTIKVRWTRPGGHFWTCKDKLISNIFLWTPTHGHTSVSQPCCQHKLMMMKHCKVLYMDQHQDTQRGESKIKKKTNSKIWQELSFIGLVWFSGISTLVGYLMPNPLYTYRLNI